MDPKLIKNGEGKFIMEGDECTQIYAHTDKLVFSVSTLLPGIQGTLMLHLPDTDEYFHMEKGDCLLIPPGAAHYSINVGEKTSIAAWACAPHL